MNNNKNNMIECKSEMKPSSQHHYLTNNLLLANSNNNHLESNDHNNLAFISSLQKLGFSNEQVIELWKEREKTSRIKMITNQSNQDSLMMMEKKRKLEIINGDDHEEKPKMSRYSNTTSEIFQMCDDVMVIVLSFINVNLEAFNLMFVSKQFMRAVLRLKTLNINVRIEFRSERKYLYCAIGMFSISKLYETIERLTLVDEIPTKLFEWVVKRCINVKYMKVLINERFDQLPFSKPTIEELHIIGKKKVKLLLANYCNLKSLRVSGKENPVLLGQVVNNFTNSLEKLYIEHLHQEANTIENLLILKNLTTLEISIRTWGHLCLILSKLQTLKEVRVNILQNNPEMLSGINCPNLQYLLVRNKSMVDVSELGSFTMPNLSTLILQDVKIDCRFTNNSSLSNLKHLNLDAHLLKPIFESICKSKYLTNIEFLRLASSFSYYCRFDYLVTSNINNLKHLELENGFLLMEDLLKDDTKFRQLETLNLKYSETIDEDVWDMFATSKSFPNLKTLGTVELSIVEGRLEKLCNNPSFHNLTHLDCDINQKAIPHIKKLKNLKLISISQNEMDSNGYRELLSSWPGLKFTGFYNALALDATIYYENGNYKIKNGIYDLRSGVAAAHYDDSYEVKGWDVLSIETNGLIKDELQSYAAGYLEGVLTRKRIHNHFVNLNTYVWADSPDKKMPQYVRDFLESQRAWVRDSSEKYANDPFWQQIRTVYLQMEGLVEGYNYATTNNSEKISYAELQVMSSSGDLFDIVNVKKDFRPNFNRMNSDQILQFARDNGHCSALFKVAPDFSNIYFAHTSWFVYSAIIRIFKTYTFNFNNKLVASPKVSFSGYPATLASNDDFYITQSGLVVIETSNNIFNTSLYDLLTPKSLLCWQRVILANRLADDAPSWSKIFSEYNSGTYNNQFMVLDSKKFIPGQPLAKDLFWVVEQIPGKVVGADQTQILSFGYWPSYNVPFYKEVFTISGYPEILKRPNTSEMLSYETCVRANIFRRDQNKVNSIDTIKNLLRYNDWKNDPLSLGNPGYAISSRNDLSPTATDATRSCSGGYDTKVSSILDINTVHIINGPTSVDQPVFVWNGQCPSKFSHVGMKQYFKYDWMTIKWN